MNNNKSSTVDLDEKSFEDLLKKLRGSGSLTPIRHVIPQSVKEAIATEFGEVTEANYIRWWRKRFGL